MTPERIVRRIWEASEGRTDVRAWQELLSDVAFWSVGKSRGHVAHVRGALGTATQDVEGPERDVIATGVVMLRAIEQALARDEAEAQETS